MGSPTRTSRTAVAARTESDRLCTVTVAPDPLGKHALRYEGSENTAALLTPEVVELLVVALSVRGRSTIPARCPSGGACTLVVIGHENGRTSLYFHGSTATSAVLDAKGTAKLRTALESLSGTGH
ncbi:MAG TPA: hypothetical protein VFQ77_07175 [Pseudonocardiaceae bacterium]|nr:hypothetical protein [Pseudonocardiaceae bacterium]